MQPDDARFHSVRGLSAAMRRAMHVALTEMDRDDGSARTVAERCRDLPAEVVDAAFADALRSLLSARVGEPRQMASVFGVAEDFVHLAGRDRFGYATRSLVSEALDGPLSSAREAGEPTGLASARAFALALNVTLGRPLGLDQLLRETLIRDLVPGLWLDLARDQLTPAGFLNAVGEGLRRRSLSPADLVVRLPGIVARQGGAIAQSALDAACRAMYADGLYDEAVDLVARANAITKSEFRQAPGQIPSWARGHETVDQLVTMFSHVIRDDRSDTRAVYIELRLTLDPVLCHCFDLEEEARRERRRADLVAAVRNSSHIEEYRFMMILEAAQPAGGPSRCWWWMALSSGIGLQIADETFKELLLKLSDIPVFPYAQERNDEHHGRVNPLFRLLRRADPCGLRR